MTAKKKASPSAKDVKKSEVNPETNKQTDPAGLPDGGKGTAPSGAGTGTKTDKESPEGKSLLAEDKSGVVTESDKKKEKALAEMSSPKDIKGKDLNNGNLQSGQDSGNMGPGPDPDKVKTKFRCYNIVDLPNGTKQYEFAAALDQVNKSFAEHTPQGTLCLTVSGGTDAFKLFELGGTLNVEFSK